MKSGVTQEFDYGCGVACFAFACDLSYRQAANHLGREQSVKHGWRPSDLAEALNTYDLQYKNRYVRKKDLAESEYPEGSIVLIERSHLYPVGHYLIRYSGRWMDPWINLPDSYNLAGAKSGFRKKLPGKAMYALIPESS